MFTKTMTGRVLGVAGVLAFAAATQACNSNQEDANVGIQGNSDPNAYTIYNGGNVTYTYQPTATKGGDGKYQPKPPSSYTVRWSLCKWYHSSEENNVLNNSRIFQVDETNDGKNYPLSPHFRQVPLVNPDAKEIAVQWAPIDSVLAETKKYGGKPLLSTAYYTTPKDSKDQFQINRAGKRETVLKIGQSVIYKGIVWTIASEDLGNPYVFTHPKYGQGLAYFDHCFRSKQAQNHDTAGRVASGSELSALCIVEDNNQEYNALSYYGYRPLWNYATSSVPMGNDPAVHPHPDQCSSYDKDSTLAGVYWYKDFSAAMNDMNGNERDASGGYYVGEEFCHMVVSGGYEVPGAKRPATKSYPYPGVIAKTSPLLWRPVNTSLTIANDQEVPPDPYEPEPVPASDY